MKLTCPSCGAMASAEAWEGDARARQMLKAACELPGPVARHTLQYLALFRPAGGRGLSWGKALRLVGELSALVTVAHIAWDKKPARKNSAAAWGQALERVIECPPRRLPLKTHGYLHAIAYDIADEMDKTEEKKYIRKEQISDIGRSKSGAVAGPERIDREVLRKIREDNYKGRKA